MPQTHPCQGRTLPPQVAGGSAPSPHRWKGQSLVRGAAAAGLALWASPTACGTSPGGHTSTPPFRWGRTSPTRVGGGAPLPSPPPSPPSPPRCGVPRLEATSHPQQLAQKAGPRCCRGCCCCCCCCCCFCCCCVLRCCCQALRRAAPAAAAPPSAPFPQGLWTRARPGARAPLQIGKSIPHLVWAELLLLLLLLKLLLLEGGEGAAAPPPTPWSSPRAAPR